MTHISAISCLDKSVIKLAFYYIISFEFENIFLLFPTAFTYTKKKIPLKKAAATAFLFFQCFSNAIFRIFQPEKIN
jgi:fucose permease